ncbi:hypothetical protein H8D30_05835 [bacterium]|nr:hypothetical protein [bacterium]
MDKNRHRRAEGLGRKGLLLLTTLLLASCGVEPFVFSIAVEPGGAVSMHWVEKGVINPSLNDVCATPSHHDRPVAYFESRGIDGTFSSWAEEKGPSQEEGLINCWVHGKIDYATTEDWSRHFAEIEADFLSDWHLDTEDLFIPPLPGSLERSVGEDGALTVVVGTETMKTLLELTRLKGSLMEIRLRLPCAVESLTPGLGVQEEEGKVAVWRFRVSPGQPVEVTARTAPGCEVPPVPPA